MGLVEQTEQNRYKFWEQAVCWNQIWNLELAAAFFINTKIWDNQWSLKLNFVDLKKQKGKSSHSTIHYMMLWKLVIWLAPERDYYTYFAGFMPLSEYEEDEIQRVKNLEEDNSIIFMSCSCIPSHTWLITVKLILCFPISILYADMKFPYFSFWKLGKCFALIYPSKWDFDTVFFMESFFLSSLTISFWEIHHAL